MNQSLDERLSLESDLRHALTLGQLQLAFQPKLALSDKHLLGMEVLLRWPHPERGWVPPDRFIPVAEECGLINALDAWVLEAACRQLRAWQELGLDGLNLSVNVSAMRFLQDDVAAHVQQQLQRHGLQAGQLTLEVTERLMLDERGRPHEQLEALDALGVRLSVDDFGTGYSSLSYLKRLPVSEIKLDKSFVHDLDTDPDDRALASAVISIGQALDLSVVAEGVETEAQRETLLRLGCKIGQGWLFGRPMDANAMTAWLRQQ
jgi:EAL domain-containing protein (putative c-di-GMP-specific phosphodiesterase class I)